jgi:hypothetical protein
LYEVAEILYNLEFENLIIWSIDVFLLE